MILPIVYWPDPILRAKCEPVPEVTDAVRWFLGELTETMLDAKGAGLSAPQVGRAMRAIVVRAGDIESNKVIALVNPRIVEFSPERVLRREGCLSLPNAYESVLRAVWVRAEGLGEDGKPVEVRAEGLCAHALQHEIEHLDGMVFTDHLSPLKRSMVFKKAKKELALLRAEAEEQYEDDVATT